jgi:hypothetical protein
MINVACDSIELQLASLVVHEAIFCHSGIANTWEAIRDLRSV